MTSSKLKVGLLVIAAQCLTLNLARAADFEKDLKILSDKQKTESGMIEDKIRAVNAKYDPAIKTLETQLNDQKSKLSGELAPLQGQLKALQDKYSASMKPLQSVVDAKTQLKALDAKEAAEKKTLADAKAAALKVKGALAKDINKKYGDDMKALDLRYKTDRGNLNAAYKKALAEASAKK